MKDLITITLNETYLTRRPHWDWSFLTYQVQLWLDLNGGTAGDQKIKSLFLCQFHHHIPIGQAHRYTVERIDIFKSHFWSLLLINVWPLTQGKDRLRQNQQGKSF